jgi:hypothetical protein
MNDTVIQRNSLFAYYQLSPQNAVLSTPKVSLASAGPAQVRGVLSSIKVAPPINWVYRFPTVSL